MPVAFRAREAVLSVTITATVVGATLVPATAASAEPPEAPPAAVARKELASLTIAAPHSMAGYNRAKFPHWNKQGHNCSTREVVL